VIKFTIKIILIGLFLGALSTSVTMLLGIALYYAVEATELFLSAYFLNYAAWLALVIGLGCALAWYIYILTLARKYFIQIVDQFVSSFSNQETKK